MTIEERKIAKGRDWEAIEATYVHGVYDKKSNRTVFLTLNEISERYDIPVSTVYNQSALRNWQMKRNIFRNYINEQRSKELMRERCYQLATSDGNTIAQMGRLSNAINDTLDQHEGGEASLAPKDIMTLVTASEKIHAIHTKIFGETRSMEEIYNDAREKFQRKKEERDVSHEDIADVIRSLKERTIEAEVVSSDVGNST